MILLQRRKLLSSEIYGIYHQRRGRYGSPRITKELEAKLDVELGGYMTYSRKCGADYGVQGKATGIYYQDVIFFSGLKGALNQRLTTKIENESIFNSNPQDKPKFFFSV